MISVPCIAHSTTPIPGSDLFRHESFFIVSHQTVTGDKETNNSTAEKKLYLEVYGQIQQALATALNLYSADPTTALRQIRTIETTLKNLHS